MQGLQIICYCYRSQNQRPPLAEHVGLEPLLYRDRVICKPLHYMLHLYVVPPLGPSTSTNWPKKIKKFEKFEKRIFLPCYRYTMAQYSGPSGLEPDPAVPDTMYLFYSLQICGHLGIRTQSPECKSGVLAS